MEKNNYLVDEPRRCSIVLSKASSHHVSINKPFKGYFREKYDDWLRQGVFEFTTGDNMKAPSHFQQIQWVLHTWSKVPKDVVIKSFDVCGITQDDPAKGPIISYEGGPGRFVFVLGNIFGGYFRTMK